MTKMEHKDDILLIEDCLDNKLTERESLMFDSRLETDKDFRKLFAFRKKLRDDLLRATQYSEILNAVKSSVKSVENKKKKKRIMYAVAASIVFAVVVSGIFISNPQKNGGTCIADSDTVKSNAIVPKINLPDSYGEQGQVIVERNMDITEDADSVYFKYENQPKQNVYFRLYVDKGELLVDTVWNNPLRKLGISKEYLPPGIIYWHVNREKGSFELTKEKLLVK